MSGDNVHEREIKKINNEKWSIDYILFHSILIVTRNGRSPFCLMLIEMKGWCSSCFKERKIKAYQYNNMIVFVNLHPPPPKKKEKKERIRSSRVISNLNNEFFNYKL